LLIIRIPREDLPGLSEYCFLPSWPPPTCTIRLRWVKNLHLPDTCFWAAHALDAVRFEGYLGEEKKEMLALLDQAIENMDEEKFTRAFMREMRSIQGDR